MASNRLLSERDLGLTAMVHLNNIKVVNFKSDFPTPSGGIITLAANTVYLLGASINLNGDKFTGGENSRITCHGLGANVISSTGIPASSYLFTAVDVKFSISDIAIDCSGAKFINYSNSAATKNLSITNNEIENSTDLGIVDGDFICNLSENIFSNHSAGLTIKGTVNELFIDSNIFLDWTGTSTQISIPSGAFHTIRISNNSFHVLPSQTALDISAGLDLNAGGFIISNTFEDGGTSLVGVDASHPDWNIPVDSNVGLTGLLRLAPFQIVDTTYSTTIDTLGLTTDPYLLNVPEDYQELATIFKSGLIDAWVDHGQSGQDVVICLANNNAVTGDEILGYGFTGKFTITNITYLSGVTRYEFDGKNGETTIDPFDLTRVHVGEMATFENCTNVSNDGTYIIAAVNDIGTKYVEVFNTNRTDSTDDEVASPGESWGGSIIWETIAVAGTYQEVIIPSVELPSKSDIRVGLRRGSISGGNPTIYLSKESDIGGEEDGWITSINY